MSVRRARACDESLGGHALANLRTASAWQPRAAEDLR
jgi:hypothetical protein